MDHLLGGDALLPRRFPRTRGDGPPPMIPVTEGSRVPPHARGWTCPGCPAPRSTPGSPHAGVVYRPSPGGVNAGSTCALLVLLSAAAGAGIASADFEPVPADGRGLRRGARCLLWIN